MNALQSIKNIVNVIDALIADYTVSKLVNTGLLISPDLLDFKEWLHKKVDDLDKQESNDVQS